MWKDSNIFVTDAVHVWVKLLEQYYLQIIDYSLYIYFAYNISLSYPDVNKFW